MKKIIGVVVVALLPLKINSSWAEFTSHIDITGAKQTSSTVSTLKIDSNKNPIQDIQNEKNQYILDQYGETIKEYSEEYKIDWRFVLAIMRQESGFDTSAESDKGAIGLMQIMPETFLNVCDDSCINDITNPEQNIVAGIRHLSTLLDLFKSLDREDRLELTLAAYNAGLGRVIDAQQLASFLSDDSKSWKGVKVALPMLSKNFSTLHKMVWDSDHPRYGYFKDSRQTIEYVDRVMQSYNRYQQMYN